MGNIIFIIVVVWIIFGNVKKQNRANAARGNNTPNAGQTNQQRTYQQPQTSYNRTQSTTQQQRYGQPNTANRQPNTYQQRVDAQQTAYQQRNASEAEYRKQQELKDRLRQQFGSAMPAAGTKNTKAQPPQKAKQPVRNAGGDILYRAKENIREIDEEDTLQATAKNSSDSQNTQPARDVYVPNMDTMAIMGKQGDMTTLLTVDITKGSEEMKQVSDLMITGYQSKLPYERDFVSEGIEMLNSYGQGI